AAVDEAVNQARRFRLASAAGFVNAVLRKAALAQVDTPPELQPPDAADARRHAEFVLSHPPALFDRIRKLVATDEAALALCRHNNAEPPTLVRLSPGTDPAALAGEGLEVLRHEQAGIAVVVGGKQRHFAAWAEAGLAQVQDATSAKLGQLIDAKPGMRVLDRCCGNGTKTFQILEMMGHDGEVLAVDADAKRIERLQQSLAKRGCAGRGGAGVTARHAGEVDADTDGLFDRILIDAPCSNSGVLPRRPEAKYRQDARRLASLAELQRDILKNTLGLLAPGGKLIYLTCSLWPEENEAVADALGQLRPDLEEVARHRVMPSFGEGPVNRQETYRDGGFGVVFRRK
ncbi:MAG: RsmB/NOP family class I SAM-dependent RNA methyltransferase, partial [Phycisphaerae bacterium]